MNEAAQERIGALMPILAKALEQTLNEHAEQPMCFVLIVVPQQVDPEEHATMANYISNFGEMEDTIEELYKIIEMLKDGIVPPGQVVN